MSRVQAAGRRAFPGFELRVLARTPSTQDVVRAAARAGAAEGWCCVAAEQTAGRGRLGRRWEAPAGRALLVSVLLRPPAVLAGAVPLLGGVAVADAVVACSGVQVGLKWPNDVLAADGGKLAGVLAEVEPAPAGAARARGLAVVVGVGLNLTVDDFPPGVAGASLHRLAGRAVGWEEALAALLTALGARLAELREGGVAATVAAWRERAVGIGARVTVHTAHGPVEGDIAGIADDGALLLATAAGGEVRVLAGDVRLD
jgi:BirA family biotin operon repressor/biotin-[acetyl-CoA-carboxylase] ligase